MPIPTGPEQRFRASELALDDGDPVATWPDEGDLGVDLTQGTANRRPVYKAATFNDRPAVEFDGSDDRLQTADYAAALSQPNTIVVVGEWITFTDDDTSTVHLFDGKTAGRNMIFPSHTVALSPYRMFAGTTRAATASPVVGVPVLLVAIFNGASSELYENEVDIFSEASPGAQTLSGFTLGHRFTDTAAAIGAAFRYAEVLVYNRALDSAELAELGEYVQVTYDIDLGYEGEPEPPPEPPPPTSHTDLWEWLFHVEREGAL
jgi:hypothetical protein